MIEQVRTVKPEILRRLVQIETEAFGEGGLNVWHIVPLIRHGNVYVAKNNQKIVGLVQYMLDWDNPSIAYMIGISIAKEERGQGLGTKLIEESLKDLASRNIAEVELTVDPQNTAAINLYQNKLGFIVTDYRTNEYGEGENRLVMRLLLKKLAG